MSTLTRARMLISCPDGPGIVAAVTQFLYERGANIVQSDQYSTDPSGGTFFMRIEFDIPLQGQISTMTALRQSFQPIASRFDMDWSMRPSEQKKRMAIFVSKHPHCLQELLWQWQIGDLPVEIPMVISNHPDLRPAVEALGVDYHHLPIDKENKRVQEQKQLELMEGQVDFIVLARYMQILTPQMLEAYPHNIINIHHSFLPAFAGANPYQQAYDRGVKIIGATAHYVTKELDAGPVIEQDVVRVNHKYDPERLKRKGRSIERTVLARAVKWHIEDRILVYRNKTVVFN